MSGVSKLIEIESEFNYDLLLYCWVKFNLAESCTLNKKLVNVIHQANIKKTNLLSSELTDYPPAPQSHTSPHSHHALQ